MGQTTHASRRAQQRAVPPLVTEWLDRYGEEEFDGRGGVVRYFSRTSIRKMQRDLGRAPVARLSEYLDCYLIQSSRDQTLITVGHRAARIWRR